MNNTFVKADQILSEFHFSILSQNARRLYSTIWNRFKGRNITFLWQYDEDVARRSYFSLSSLQSAQAELVRAGLIHLTPGLVQSKYELVDADDTISNIYPTGAAALESFS